MRMVESLLERAGLVAGVVQIVEDIAKIEIVQDHDARMPFQQPEHVLVYRRIAEMVEHPVVFVHMGFEPGHGTQRQVGLDPRIADKVLVDDQIDIVKTCQFRNQFRTVVGDAGFFGWQRRNIG